MAKSMKKLLSLVLAMVMVLSLIPAVSAAETNEEVTEPAATEAATEATEPAASEENEPADPDAIAIGTADEWHEWFMRNTNKLIEEYSNKDEVAKFLLTADITTTPNNLYYFGTTQGNTVKAEIDLGGHTLTVTGSSTSRLFGIYDGSALTIKNGTIVLNKPFGAVNGGMFLINKGTLNLDNMVIDDIGEHKFNYNGKLMQIGAGNTVTMTNTTIRSNTKANTSQYNTAGNLSYGIGAMIMIQGTLVAENCNFVASTETNATDNNGLTYYGGMITHQAGTNATYTNCTFDGGYARYGGALAIRAGTATISGCTFKNNKAINGGAVYVIGNSTNATITDTTFENTAAVSFSGNNLGGALSVEGGAATVKGCEFKNNTAKYGAAIHVGLTALEGDKATNGTSIGSMKLEDSTITGAVATARGGGVHVYNANSTKQTLEMINTDIIDCVAPDGGGVALFGCSNTIITGGSIKNCTANGAKGQGGNLYIINNGYAVNSHNVTVTDTLIEGGTAAEAGNILIQNKAKMKPNMVDFVNVTMRGGVAVSPAGTDGYSGNIYVAGVDLVSGDTTYRCTVNMNGCTVEDGKSNYGANVGVAGLSTVNITDTILRNGEAAKGGGNLYVGNANAVVNVYGNTQILNGKSGAYGGNIRIGSGQLNILNATIEGGEAKSGGASIWVNSNASAFVHVYGGVIRTAQVEKAVAVAGDLGTLKLLNCTTEGFDASEFVVYGESYATQTGENAYTVKHYAVDGATTKEGTCETAGTVTIVCPDCEHTYVYENQEGHAIVIDKAVAPTCTESGLTEGQHCTVCAAVLVAQEEIAATGHSPAEAVKENEVAHTCTTDGSYDSVIYCEVCKIELSREVGVVDPAAHTEQIVEGKAPTCTETGLTEGKVCSVCGETLVAQEEIPAAHTEKIVEGKAPTCTETGLTEGKVCEICGEVLVAQEELPVAEHAWDAGVYTEPTYEADGYTTYTCTACGETKNETDEGSMLTKAEITKQPEAVNAETGTEVQFHVEAEGNIVSYKWEYRKVWKWFNTSMTGYNTDTLTVTANGARNGYDYRCEITFADGTVLYSEPAELTVNTYITEVVGPNDQTVVLGYKGQFTASAQGEGIKYQWQYKRPDGTQWIDTAMEGCTKPTVLIETTTARDGYQYRCEITDVTGNVVVYTEPATMRVLSFKSHPAEAFAATGSEVQFTVTTSVDSGFTYQWQYSKDGVKWSNTTLAGYNTATLTVGATLARNGYMYRCQLTGSKNSKIESKVAVLHVGDPVVITAQPQAVTVAAGEVATFTVVAENAYAYQWQYQRPTGTTWGNTSADGNQTATLNVTTKASNNGYKYRCIIYGLDGTETITEFATLTIG